MFSWFTVLSQSACCRLLCGIVLLLGLPFSAAASVDLGTAERAWLSDHAKGVRVGVIEIPPLVMRENGRSGFHGMAIDFMQRYENALGIKVDYVLFPSWKELLDAAREKKVDLVLTTVDTPERRTYLDFPPPYVTLKNVIISRQGDVDGEIDLSQLGGKRVAVLEASAVHERIVREYPDIRVYPLREERTLLSAVAFREADFAVTELSRAVWWIQHERLTVLRVVGATPFDYALSVAVRNDWPEMTSVMTKVTRDFSPDTAEEITRQWAYFDETPWVERSSVAGGLVVILLGGLLLLVMALIIILFLRRRVAVGTAEMTRQLEQAEAMRQQLLGSERKFRELAELTSDMFWETNDRLVFVRFYGGGLAHSRTAEHELIGKAWWDLPLLGVEASDVLALKDNMERHEAFRRWICRMSDAGGATRWLSVSGQAVFDPQGTFVGYRGTGQDVTERMQQQERLTDALQRMQAVQDGTYSFLGLLSPDGRMLDCNRAALEFIDRQKSDVIGRLFWELPWWRLPEEVNRVREAMTAAANGEFVRFDARIVDAAGSSHWIDFSLSPFYDESGTLRYLVPESRDITEAKRASAALDNLMSSTGAVYGEAFFRKVVESMGRLLAVKYVLIGALMPGLQRVRSVATWAGDAFADNFEYDLAATPCENVMSFGCCVYPRDVQSLFPDDVQLKEMGVESYVGVPVVGASGQPIGILVVLHDQPLIDTAGMRRMMELFSVRAATEFERMAYEDEIRALNTGLESRVAERTEALQQANRELEAFSYSVSHDLRAPLRHIAGFVELLIEESGESLSAEGRRYLGVISDSAGRMGMMIDDLLAFSRAGRSEVRKAMINLRQLVDDAIRQMERDLANRRVEWKIGDLPQINADRGLMSLVLNNLIGNAVKYSRARDPAVIEIGVDERGGGDEVIVFVRDNGIGFDMKYVHKLFGVFQRLHNDSEYEGTGIGLANVRRIIERHGGRVWAEAIENQGSTFYFALPVLAERPPVALAA